MPKTSACIWKCRRTTNSRSRICDSCWSAAAPLRSFTDGGFKAWVKKAQAKAQAGRDPRKVAAGRITALRRRSSNPSNMPAI